MSSNRPGEERLSKTANEAQPKESESTPAAEARISRRGLLAATAATAVACAAPGLGKQSGATGSKRTDFDSIIVGAGFAGATAAREIGANGRSVLVLEARNRLGGRTFTSQFLDHEVEYGGAWVHWLQPHIWSELERYGRGIVEDPLVNLDKTVVMFNDGRTQEIDPLEFDRSFGDAFLKYNHDSRDLFPRPFDTTFDPRVIEIDKQSAADRIASLDLDKVQVAQLRGMLALYGGGLTSEYGVPGILKVFACAGWNHPAFADAETHYRIEGGTIGLLGDMLEDSGAEVVTGTPVSSVEQSGGKVKVTTEDGDVYTAATCVVTVPLNTLGAIQFSPPLSPAKQALIKEGQLSQGAKLYVHLKEDLGRFFAFCDEEQPLNWVQTHTSSPEFGTMLSITVARASTLNVNDPAAVADSIRALIPGATVLASSAYDWAADPFSRGAWPAHRVGQFTRIGALREPEDRVFLAGAVTAKGWHEYIDGAVESGLRTGRGVREILS
jgi:monoamine oxidase